MADRTRPYLFYDAAVSLCATCFRKVDGKHVIEDGRVFLLKRCPEHGAERVLVADDAAYWRRAREVFLKPSEMPNRFNTETRWGCPYDCGICPDHEQHSCLTLVEVTDACNLACPVCYAGSGPHRPGFLSVAEVEALYDLIVANEREPDVVQLSGGEPTLHPQFFELLDAAKRRPIKHLMVNTNGLRIADDDAFVDRLAGYRSGFEVYLQFDAFEKDALMELRGADLRAVRMRALDRLDARGISTTLVVTLKKGLNDHEIGRILDFAVTRPCVRGVTFQPVQEAGRVDGYDPARHRLTLTEVRRKIAEQSTLFSLDDVIPVPCHPDAIAMAYGLKLDGGFAPLTRYVDAQTLIDGGRNTIVYEKDAGLQRALFKTFSTAHSPESATASLKDLLCCLPKVAAPELAYDRVFRVIIMAFLDAQAFDLRSVKKTCVHIARPDGRIIPFDTFNLFYRGDLERTRLDPLRRAAEAATHGTAV
ncbi:MAG TPA: radical SAM protein [Planctomycetota bacterium]|nr:radical SAM protein [Planctomycetota bacterium]